MRLSIKGVNRKVNASFFAAAALNVSGVKITLGAREMAGSRAKKRLREGSRFLFAP